MGRHQRKAISGRGAGMAGHREAYHVICVASSSMLNGRAAGREIDNERMYSTTVMRKSIVSASFYLGEHHFTSVK